MNNPESFTLESAVASISLIAQMQAVIDDQEQTITAMVKEIAWWRTSGSLAVSPAKLNLLDTTVDFR